MGPIRVRTYRDGSAEATARLFEAATNDAAQAGFYPTAQACQARARRSPFNVGRPPTDGADKDQDTNED